MENLRAFKVTYVKPTNTAPARVRIQDLRFDKSIIVNYGAETPDTANELAIHAMNNKGIQIKAQAWAESSGSQFEYSILLTDNFIDQIK